MARTAEKFPARVVNLQPGGRVPPHNLQAEESLLGAMLLDREAIALAVEVVSAADFYKPAHVHIFEAIMTLYGSGEPADPVTVAATLTTAGVLEAIGGPGILLSLQVNTPSVSSAKRYAHIIEELALLRRMISTAGEIAEIGYGLPDDVTKAVDSAEQLMFRVGEKRNADTLKPINELLDAGFNHIEALYERGSSITGTPTGYTDLDRELSGLQPSALIIVGARPAMGKTAFALGAATHAAMHGGKPVLFFSLEMSHVEITQRMLCSEAGIDSTRIKTGQITDVEWSKLSHAVGRLAEAPIWIDDNPNVTVMEIRGKARRQKAKLGDLGLVVIDYLQLMTGRASAENRQVEVSEISRNLKILARELECPVMALSQLSRGLELRADKRPMLADLRESGSLEQDADVVLFLYRDEIYNAESQERGQAEVIIAKHRSGPTGKVRLAFHGPQTKFVNMAKGPM